MSTGPGFDDLNVALRMRDTIARLVRAEVDKYRPAEQYGRVIDVNRMALTAAVLLNGDVEPIKVKMSAHVQPLETDTLNGAGNGCMVLVGGASGSYWIKAIASGHAYSGGLGVSDMHLYGGTQEIAVHQVVTALLPAVGSVYHIGRWDNSNSSTQDGRGFIEISVRQDVFSSLMKTYQVSLKVNATNGTWQKLASSTDHGIYAGNDFELEIMSDTAGFELRVRRTKDGGGFTPGSYICSIWAYMDSVTYDATSVGESAAAAPTSMFNTVTPGDDNGPYLSYGLNYNNRTQFNIMGGGQVKMNLSTNIFSWNERFLILGQGRNQYSPVGFYDCTQPANGTSIPVYGSALATSVSATTAGIPLQSSQTLYYEVPYGNSASASVAANFRIVAHDDSAQIFTVPSHWVMIASRATSLTLSGDCKLGTGQQLNGPAWEDYSPTMFGSTSGGTIGNATKFARFRRDGSSVLFSCTITWGSTTSAGVGQMRISLPVPVQNTNPRIIGHGMMTQGSARQVFVVNVSGLNECNLIGYSGSIYDAGVPVTWATGDTIRMNGSYECDVP